MFSFIDLPNEVIHLILSSNNIDDIISFSKTCKPANNLCKFRCIKELIIDRPNLEHLPDEQIDNLYNIVTNNISGDLYINDGNNVKLYCQNVKLFEFTSGMTNLIVKTDGSAYRLKKPKFSDSNNIFTNPSIRSNIKQVSIGDDYMLYLDNTGNVYGSGNNRNGKMGSIKSNNINDFQKIKELSNIKSISCTDTYSLFLDYDGNVYSCGYGKYYQLGSATEKSTHKATKIPNLPKISKIKATTKTSFFISKEGTLYYCGLDPFSEYSSKPKYKPKQMSGIPPIHKIIILHKILYLGMNGDLYYDSFDKPILENIIDVTVIHHTKILCLNTNGTVFSYSIFSDETNILDSDVKNIKQIKYHDEITYIIA